MRSLAILLLIALPVLGAGMEAEVAGAAVHVKLEPQEARSVYVVVTHEDELVGPVVDRLVPVELSPTAHVEVTVEHLRPDARFSVRLVNASHSEAPEETPLELLGRAATAPGSWQAVGDELGRFGLAERVYAYEIASAREHRSDRWLLSAPDGTLALFAAEMTPAGHAEATVRLSRDGGHRFGEAIRWAPGLEVATMAAFNRGGLFATIGLDGSFLAVATQDDEDTFLQSWTAASIDPRSGAVETSSGTFAAPQFSDYVPLILPDGGVHLMAPGGESHDGQRLWRLEGKGATLVAPVEHAPGVRLFTGEATIAVSPTGAIAAMWLVGSIGDVQVRMAASPDGGASWYAAHNVSLPAYPWIIDASIDSTGTAHFLVAAGMGDERRTAYVRLPPGEPPTLSWLEGNVSWDRGPVAYISQAYLQSSGGRVWIAANAAAEEDMVWHEGGAAYRSNPVLWESTNGGATFGSGHEMGVSGWDHIRYDAPPAILPDGRPVVLADAGGRWHALPLFDPLPEPACATSQPATGTPSSTPTGSSSPQGAPATCPERLSLDAVPGDVRIVTTKTIINDPVPGASETFPARPVAATVGGALAAISLWRLFPMLLGSMAAGLFSRVRDHPLEHPLRAQLLAWIDGHPGASVRDLTRALHLARGRARYHLCVLEQAGILRSRRVGGGRRYYPRGMAAPPEGRDAVLAYLHSHPGAGPAEMGRHLGLTRQAVHYHLQRLEAEGAVRRHSRGYRR